MFCLWSSPDRLLAQRSPGWLNTRPLSPSCPQPRISYSYARWGEQAQQRQPRSFAIWNKRLLSIYERIFVIPLLVYEPPRDNNKSLLRLQPRLHSGFKGNSQYFLKTTFQAIDAILA